MEHSDTVAGGTFKTDFITRTSTGSFNNKCNQTLLFFFSRLKKGSGFCSELKLDFHDSYVYATVSVSEPTLKHDGDQVVCVLFFFSQYSVNTFIFLIIFLQFIRLVYLCVSFDGIM